MVPLNTVIQEIIHFREDRDWKKFHTPKDLSIALNIESSELLEAFLWKEVGTENTDDVKEELADVFIYGILLAEHYGWDLTELILEKLKLNAIKYPVDKAKGNSRKYDQL